VPRIESKWPSFRAAGLMIVAYKRSWREVFPERGRISQERSKKHSEGEACGNCRNYGKKQNAALLFPTVAWISRAQKTCSAYPQFPQARRTATNINRTILGTNRNGPFRICGLWKLWKSANNVRIPTVSTSPQKRRSPRAAPRRLRGYAKRRACPTEKSHLQKKENQKRVKKPKPDNSRINKTGQLHVSMTAARCFCGGREHLLTLKKERDSRWGRRPFSGEAGGGTLALRS